MLNFVKVSKSRDLLNLLLGLLLLPLGPLPLIVTMATQLDSVDKSVDKKIDNLSDAFNVKILCYV